MRPRLTSRRMRWAHRASPACGFGNGVSPRYDSDCDRNPTHRLAVTVSAAGRWWPPLPSELVTLSGDLRPENFGLVAVEREDLADQVAHRFRAAFVEDQN